ncbi:MAG TPA: hypothetical protein VGC44_10260 [Longimicrobiales bacterium]
MQLLQLDSPRARRRFTWYWAALTATYLASAFYRTIELQQPLRLATLAGVCAITAVWLETIALTNPGVTPRAGVILTLFATVVLNVADIIRSGMAQHGFPFGRSLFTLLLSWFLADRIRAFVTLRAH